MEKTMPCGVRIVEEAVEVDVVPLEQRLSRAVKVIRRLEGLCLWHELRCGVHLRRRAGSYEALDLVLFLAACFSSGSGDDFKDFAKETASNGRELAALIGRDRWMGQSAVSRALSAVCDECLEELAAVMRGLWPQALALHSLSALGHRDAFDRPWQVFHYDGSVVPVRQRQLPQGDDMPAPRRSSATIAARGYPGRKRAEAVVQRTLTQEAHSTWWIAASVEPGNGDAHAMATVGAGEAAAYTAEESPRARAVFVADGGGGGWAPLRAAIEAGLYGLVRCSNYHWLDDRDVRKRVYEPGWFAVPDSRSGPSRSAKELGIWRDTSGHLFRVIVSRFAAAEAKTERGGAGREIDGWHYELYLFDAPADAWPAHETVRLYYDRCGQENRFAMLNRRYHLDRIFSFHKQGQALATLVGLMVWNVEVLLGAEALGSWDENHPDLEPTPRNDIPVPPPAPGVDSPDGAAADATASSEGHSCEPEAMANGSIAAEATPSAAEPDATANGTTDGAGPIESTSEPGSSTHTTLVQAISRKMQDWLTTHPGWAVDETTLVCPGGTPMTSSLIDSTDTSVVIRFRSPARACRGCSLRGRCTSSANAPNFRKEIQLRAEALRVNAEDLAELRFYRRSATPTSSISPNLDGTLQSAVSAIDRGPYACRMSRLSVGELLRLYDKSSSRSLYAIEVQRPAGARSPLPPAITPTPARRQRRRKTFAERLAWNDLPPGSTVRLLTVRIRRSVAETTEVHVKEAA
jgi:hypothetical protein